MKGSHLQILTTMGFGSLPYNGEPRWIDAVPTNELLAAVEQLPDNEDEFLKIDLASYPEEIKAVQCSLIRKKREAAYQSEADGLFFGAEADGDIKVSWIAKRDEIKARYPWPGTYR